MKANEFTFLMIYHETWYIASVDKYDATNQNILPAGMELRLQYNQVGLYLFPRV